jgi:regulator of replication initiation timing
MSEYVVKEGSIIAGGVKGPGDVVKKEQCAAFDKFVESGKLIKKEDFDKLKKISIPEGPQMKSLVKENEQLKKEVADLKKRLKAAKGGKAAKADKDADKDK